jgi:hypothetical protein
MTTRRVVIRDTAGTAGGFSFNRMKATFVPLLLILLAAPLAAQVNGKWTGSYSLTDEFCPGTFTGAADLYATQTGAGVTAVLLIDMTIFDGCDTTIETLALPVSGSMSGDHLSATIFVPLADQPAIPFNGTITGTTLTGVATPPEQMMTLTLVQSSSAPLDTTFSGTYTGTYSVHDPMLDFPCVNLPALAFSGSLSATLFHEGDLIAGIVELHDRKDVERDESGKCTVVEAPDERLAFMALAGSVTEGAVFSEFETLPFTGTIDGFTIAGSGTAEDSATFAFSMTRTTADPAPAILQFNADPSAIQAGDSSTLHWSTFHASTVSIDHGIGIQPTVGSLSIAPTSTTVYTLTAMAGNGMTATATSSVQVSPVVNAPVILTFTSTPSVIRPGQCSTLAWATANATSASIAPSVGSVPVNGSTLVCPAATTTYTLTASGTGGSVRRSKAIVVADRVKRRAVRH